jgi:hypothetical protein
LPGPRELLQVAEASKRARDEALETLRWTATFDFPGFEQDYEFVALHNPNEYPFNEGRIVSNRCLDITSSEFDEHVIEEQTPYSKARQATLKARCSRLACPLARYNLNFDKLSLLLLEVTREAGPSSEWRNPFRSVIVRRGDVLYDLDETLVIEQSGDGEVLMESWQGAGTVIIIEAVMSG